MRLWLLTAGAAVMVLALVWETKAQDAVSYEDTGAWIQEPSANARSDDLSGSQQVAGNPVDISAAASNTRRRRRHKKKKRQRQQQQQNEDSDDDYYYDRDDQYGAPKAPATSYDAPAPSYNPPAPSYSPPSYSPPSYSSPSDGYGAPAYDDGGGGGGGDGFNDFLNALAAFLPIGLFLAAIPPNIITINSNTGRKKRGLNDLDTDDDEIEKYTFPFIKELQIMGYDKLEDPACQKQLFCKMATFGEEKGANYVQKSFHYISTLFPAFLARPVGLDDVFGAVQNRHCDSFNC